MTAIKTTLIYCDGRDEGLDCPLDGPISSDVGPTETAAYQREHLFPQHGWKRIKGKDYCPLCVKARATSTVAK